MVEAVLAMLALQVPEGELRLDCGLSAVGGESKAETTRLAIILAMRGQRIESAQIEGPPLFSSSQGLQLFDATPNRRGGMNVSRSEPSRRELRWTPRVDGTKIELLRQNSRITLDPDPAARGAWRGTYDLGEIRIGHLTGQGPAGVIVCRRAEAGSTGQ
jgi:hypothetical protein